MGPYNNSLIFPFFILYVLLFSFLYCWLNMVIGLFLIDDHLYSYMIELEMYYKKRPELISMVEEFYRTHRSLAERYDQLKSDSGTCLLTTLASPFTSSKSQLEKLMSVVDQTYTKIRLSQRDASTRNWKFDTKALYQNLPINAMTSSMPLTYSILCLYNLNCKQYTKYKHINRVRTFVNS